MMARETINAALFGKESEINEPFLWFTKDPENGENEILKNQAAYNTFVRHLNSLGFQYDEELDLDIGYPQNVKSIAAVVFKSNPENNSFKAFKNEYADFFDLEYDSEKEFIVIKIHYTLTE